ncbi:MAG: proteasome subunit alpha [Planctomycetes bacterium]|nr:proteasome subunit alpha [Planctomycetota bacterium]
MRLSAPQTFGELVDFQPGAPLAGDGETHGTTVLALMCTDGVVILADRRATMGSLIMFDQAEKIVALDRWTVVAISGAYARSIDVCRYLQHAFMYYERRNLQEISAQGKLMEISKALSENLQLASDGFGVFLPIAATYDRKADQFGIHFFDLAGARFESAQYACAGSGSERIRGIFEYALRDKGPWSDRSLDDVLEDGLRMLDIAADLDSATGGVRKHLPSVCVLTADGARVMDESEIRPVVAKVLQT